MLGMLLWNDHTTDTCQQNSPLESVRFYLRRHREHYLDIMDVMKQSSTEHVRCVHQGSAERSYSMPLQKWLNYMSFHSFNICRRWSGWRRTIGRLTVLTKDDSSVLKHCGKEMNVNKV